MTALTLLTFDVGAIVHGLAWWAVLSVALGLTFTAGVVHGTHVECDRWLRRAMREQRRASPSEGDDFAWSNLRLIKADRDNGPGAA